MVVNDLELSTKNEALDRFIEEFENADATARWKAVKGVGRLDPSVAASFVPRLIEALGDKSIVVRVSAAEALGRIAPAKVEVVAALTSALRDKYATVREAVTMALGNAGMGGLPAVGALRKVLTDESKYVRKEAAGALVRVASSFSGESLPILVAELSDPSSGRRVAIAFLLGEMGESARPALEVLLRLRDDPEEEVRQSAEEAIGKLNSEPGTGAPRLSVDRAAQGEDSLTASDPDFSWSDRSDTIPAFKHSSPESDESSSGSSFATPSYTSANPAGHEPGKESGTTRWHIPASLNCGSLVLGLRYERLLRIAVPVPCRLTSDSSVVSVENGQLSRGPHQVVLTIGPLHQQGPFQTYLRLSTPSIERTIDVVFEVVNATSVGHSPAPHRSILWQPSSWTKLLAKAPARAWTSSSTYRHNWESGSDSDSDSSDRPTALPEFDRGNLALVDAISPYSASPPSPVAPYQAYRVRPKPVQRYSAHSRLRLSRLVVVSTGLIAVAALLALRFIPTPEVAIPTPEVRKQPKPDVVRDSSSPTPPSPASNQAPRKLGFLAKSVDMSFSLIQSKEPFLMGFGELPDDRGGPEHLVRLTRHYYIGCYEVTRRQWNQVMPTPEHKDGDDKTPVAMVSWYDAVQFCNALSDLEKLPTYYEIHGEQASIRDQVGSGYRLPTEAEWEYACRAGKSSTWFFGDSPKDLSDYAHYSSTPDPDSAEASHPVGQKLPNPFGLYDVYGNIAEWCWDWHDDYELGKNNPSGPTKPKKNPVSRILRGGDFGNPGSDVNSFHRFYAKPETRSPFYGFRVARNPSPDEQRQIVTP